MYFVVPKGRSIIKSVFKTESLYDAQKRAECLRSEQGTHWDVISMSSVYTTQTLGELLEQDMLLAAEARGEIDLTAL
jgi:hypothetical protein